MRRIATFLFKDGPHKRRWSHKIIILYYNIIIITIVLHLPIVFSTETCCTGLQPRSSRLYRILQVCCRLYYLATIRYVNNRTCINQQLLNVKILATCFSYSEPSSGQKNILVFQISFSMLTFSPRMTHNIKCKRYGIPQNAQSQNVPELGSVFGLMVAHCS